MRVESSRRVRWLGVALVAAGLLCIAGPALAQAPTLRGTVTAETDRTPQVGATVTVSRLGVIVFTDENGQYAVSVPPGEYTVRVEAVGYVPLEKPVTVGGAPAVLDFQVAEDRLGEVIMTVGSPTPCSRLETSAPVDVITNDVISESSHTETNQILNTVAPSFNATHLSIVDGTGHIDPATPAGGVHAGRDRQVHGAVGHARPARVQRRGR